MSQIDLSKVIYSSNNNSFKNDGTIYTGSVTFPTSLTSGQNSITTTTINISSFPQFSKFYANFKEEADCVYSTGSVQWYDEIVSAGSIGIHVNTAPHVGYINCSLYPVILTNTVLITASVQNPYNVTIGLDSLTVPYAFIEYTLAN